MAGWYDADAVYLPARRLQEAAGGGLTEIEVARVLDAQGLIAKRRDSKSRYVSYVPQIGPVKAYALCRSAFGPTERDQGTEEDAGRPGSWRVYPGGCP